MERSVWRRRLGDVLIAMGAVTLLLATPILFLDAAPAASTAPLERAAPVEALPAPTSSSRSNVAPAERAPTQVRIPRLAVETAISPLDVKDNGSLEVPKDPFVVGWWRDGPAPGEKGSTVLVGHVDSLTGPGIFYRLSGLRRGDRVDVSVGDKRVRYRVQRVERVAKDDFPDARVYRTSGPETLHLLTCGGPWRGSRGYRDNVIVTAVPDRR